jgi:hypothetical protein
MLKYILPLHYLASNPVRVRLRSVRVKIGGGSTPWIWARRGFFLLGQWRLLVEFRVFVNEKGCRTLSRPRDTHST